MKPTTLTRRDSVKQLFWMGPAMMTAVSPRAAAQGVGQLGAIEKPALVAFLSRSGNTRVVAGQISRALGAELFEIETADPYPLDYRQTVEQAAQETRSGFEPPLKAAVSGIERFRTVFLGFPIWGMTAPPPIRSFLTRHPLAGQTIIPFITHGGYGIGRSLDALAEAAPRARLAPGFVMQADQERDTLERVTRWLGSAPQSS